MFISTSVKGTILRYFTIFFFNPPENRYKYIFLLQALQLPLSRGGRKYEASYMFEPIKFITSFRFCYEKKKKRKGKDSFPTKGRETTKFSIAASGERIFLHRVAREGRIWCKFVWWRILVKNKWNVSSLPSPMNVIEPVRRAHPWSASPFLRNVQIQANLEVHTGVRCRSKVKVGFQKFNLTWYRSPRSFLPIII